MDLLFKKGKAQLSHPVKMVILVTPVNLIYPAQAMFIVPKRQFKKAHDRNKLKRRMREAYRLNKNNFYQQLAAADKKVIVAFIYVSKKAEEYEVIDKAIVKLSGSFK